MARFHRNASGEIRRCDGQGCNVCDGVSIKAHADGVRAAMRLMASLMGVDPRPVRIVPPATVQAPSVPMPPVCRITRLAAQTETRKGVTRLVGERVSEQVWGRRWSRQKRALPVLVELPGGRVHSLHTSSRSLAPRTASQDALTMFDNH